jgi:hypothetical protein
MTLRAVTASFNAIAMVALAMALTGGSFTDARVTAQIWGSAAAAVCVALVVLTSGPASVAWVGIGYILFAATWAASPVVLLVLLAVAFMPIVPRPRGSLLLGAGMAMVAAIVLRLAVTRLV